MKHISVLVPTGPVIIDTVISSYNLLKMANSYYKKKQGNGQDLYTIELVGLSKNPEVYQRLFQVKPEKSIAEIEKTDLIIISAISGNLQKGIELNAEFVGWIKKQRVENGAELASLCKGAFILAETGLANHKNCSTHWTAHDEFKARYPLVNLVPEKIISEDNGIYSSGGAYSFLNFMLYLIEKFYGRETAIWCAKISEIEMDRFDQSYFMIFNGQKEHQDDAVRKAQVFIEENYEHKININQLAEKVNVSSRNFLRRFKKATANTPKEYIARVKVEAAKRQFESTVQNIQEVMLNIGYSDEQAFRNTFRKYSGLSPIEYRKKYNRELAFA
ncbi:MAG: helix-turn-helix domain-containing protein [Schleiferiaceae bacterium]|jgi:transcriptional regulator GlxA family with amidase domain|nr:helix-turn-helix domain-containing protein [Schleiferiaceae bacterium]